MGFVDRSLVSKRMTISAKPTFLAPGRLRIVSGPLLPVNCSLVGELRSIRNKINKWQGGKRIVCRFLPNSSAKCKSADTVPEGQMARFGYLRQTSF
jgi:hypothetical protein